jgi:hypothetical protein
MRTHTFSAHARTHTSTHTHTHTHADTHTHTLSRTHTHSHTRRRHSDYCERELAHRHSRCAVEHAREQMAEEILGRKCVAEQRAAGQQTSAYVIRRQHTSADVSIRQHTSVVAEEILSRECVAEQRAAKLLCQYLYCCTRILVKRST